MTTLTVTKRTQVGKASRTLMSEGNMPAIVYGPTHAAEPITIPLADFTKVLRDEGTSAVINLDGLGASFQVLIQEIDRDPVTSVPRHADFYAITKGEKITVSVPLSFVGESAAAKAGASLVKVMHELEVESDPSKLPHEIEIDLSMLAEIGSQIQVKEIKLPSGVVATGEPEEVIALAQTTEEEPEDADGAAPDMGAIEVEQKGKTDGEDDAADAS